jgi:exosome complex component RRP41
MRGAQIVCGVNYRRIQEISLALRQTFEEAVQTQLYPRSQIDISVLVLEQDGGNSPLEQAIIVGVLQTAINAVTLALVDAGVPMNDYICATSAGLVDNNAILGISALVGADARSKWY